MALVGHVDHMSLLNVTVHDFAFLGRFVKSLRLEQVFRTETAPAAYLLRGAEYIDKVWCKNVTLELTEENLFWLQPPYGTTFFKSVYLQDWNLEILFVFSHRVALCASCLTPPFVGSTPLSNLGTCPEAWLYGNFSRLYYLYVVCCCEPLSEFRALNYTGALKIARLALGWTTRTFS